MDERETALARNCKVLAVNQLYGGKMVHAIVKILVLQNHRYVKQPTYTF